MRDKMASVCVVCLLLASTSLLAMSYHRTAAVSYAECWRGARNPSFRNYCGLGGDCANFASQCLIAGFYGSFEWWQRFLREQWFDPDFWLGPNSCKKPAGLADEHGCIPLCMNLESWLTGKLNCTSVTMPPGTRYRPSWLLPGDLGMYTYYSNGAWHHHFVLFVGFDPVTGDPLFNDHCGDPNNNPDDTYHGNMMTDRADQQLEVIHVGDDQDKVLGCRTYHSGNSADSTFDLWDWKWYLRCCWKEICGGNPPWSSNPTAYFCLNWQETIGTTWDTLISHRVNCVGCSAVVLRVTSNSTLSGGDISVRGSTDDGASWPYYIGDDHLSEASLSWAANQPNVRVAWCYHGSVQANRYWCIDDVEFLAKPTLDHDIWISSIRWPKGIISYGKPVSPMVYVWNTGRLDDSTPVVFKVDNLQCETCWVSLYAYDDTLLTLPPATYPLGNHTSTAYSLLTGDEIPANDTVTGYFRVVADTWVCRQPVYSGHPTAGLGLTATDSNTVFCCPSYHKFFVKFMVWRNLWKPMAQTPMSLNGGVAFSGYNGIYGVRASMTRQLYYYNIPNNTWAQMTDAPCKMGRGARIVFGGGHYMYVLRGDRKKDFLRYDKVNNCWAYMAQTPDKIHDGSALAWNGGDYIYALRGDDKKDFYRYSISGNQWTTLSQVPYNVDDGGALTYDPTTNKLYALCGGSTHYTLCYNIAAGTWAERRAVPHPVHDGGALQYLDHEVFGCLGCGHTNDFWRYAPPVGGDDDGTKPPGREAEPRAVSAGGSSDRLLTRDGDEDGQTDECTPQYSPDGLWIAFAAHDSARECMALYVVPADGGDPVALTSDSTTYEKPVWSSDGALLAAAGDSGLYTVDVRAGTATCIAAGVVDEPRWMPGDSWVVYERWDNAKASHTIHKVRTDGTGDTCVTAGEEYFQPQPAPDGSIISVGQKGEVTQLCHIRGQSGRWLTSDYCDNACPSLSADGALLAYQKLDESSHWQVYVMDLASGIEKRLTDGTCNCETPVFSPDGSSVAYTKWPDTDEQSSGSQICYVPTDSGPETALNPPDAARANPDWSPDCAYIVFEEEVQPESTDKESSSYTALARVATGLTFRAGRVAHVNLPGFFALHQNVPNPFSLRTAIRYAIPTKTLVGLEVFDVSGRMVKRLVGSTQRPGNYTALWDGTDDSGRKVGAGTYFYILKADDRIAQRRMLLIK